MKINPLSVLGIRWLPIIPEYFSVHTISCPGGNISPRMQRELVRDLTEWIETTLSCRYSIQVVTVDSKTTIRVGIEDPSEFTFFQLGCPLIF